MLKGFKRTQKFFSSFINVLYSHPTLQNYRENYSERHTIKILYKGIYHIK